MDLRQAEACAPDCRPPTMAADVDPEHHPLARSGSAAFVPGSGSPPWAHPSYDAVVGRRPSCRRSVSWPADRAGVIWSSRLAVLDPTSDHRGSRPRRLDGHAWEAHHRGFDHAAPNGRVCHRLGRRDRRGPASASPSPEPGSQLMAYFVASTGISSTGSACRSGLARARVLSSR